MWNWYLHVKKSDQNVGIISVTFFTAIKHVSTKPQLNAGVQNSRKSFKLSCFPWQITQFHCARKQKKTYLTFQGRNRTAQNKTLSLTASCPNNWTTERKRIYSLIRLYKRPYLRHKRKTMFYLWEIFLAVGVVLCVAEGRSISPERGFWIRTPLVTSRWGLTFEERALFVYAPVVASRTRKFDVTWLLECLKLIGYRWRPCRGAFSCFFCLFS